MPLQHLWDFDITDTDAALEKTAKLSASSAIQQPLFAWHFFYSKTRCIIDSVWSVDNVTIQYYDVLFLESRGRHINRLCCRL